MPPVRLIPNWVRSRPFRTLAFAAPAPEARSQNPRPGCQFSGVLDTRRTQDFVRRVPFPAFVFFIAINSSK